MVSPDVTARLLSADDAEASRTLGFEAFGVPTTPPTEPAPLDRPGRITFGAYAGDRLIAKMSDRAYDSWFGGAEVPTCGIAGVTVAAEDRGRGALGPLLEATLRSAVARGAVISTLFATAPGIYRRFGYAFVVDYTTVRLRTDALAAVRPGSPQVTTRRATVADLPAIRTVYDTWAAAQNGPLTRRGPSFTTSDEDVIASFTGITLAVDADDAAVGFASWGRGQRYGPGANLHVSDLLALSPDAYRVLLRTLGTFASVTPTTTIDTTGDDLVRSFLPDAGWTVEHADPYMLSVLDVVGALTVRGYPSTLSADVTFTVTDHVLSEQNRTYRLRVDDGRATCEPTSTSGGPTLTARGLALLYAGPQSSGNLRFLGELTGGDATDDARLDLIFTSRPIHVRDYF